MRVRILFDSERPFAVRAYTERQKRFHGPFHGCRWVEVEEPYRTGEVEVSEQ